jgi:hypothetical protein
VSRNDQERAFGHIEHVAERANVAQGLVLVGGDREGPQAHVLVHASLQPQPTAERTSAARVEGFSRSRSV